MHSGLKIFLFFLLGTLVGAAVAIPAFFLLLLRTDAGQGLVRSYVTSSQKWPDVIALIEKSGNSATPLTREQVTKALNTPVTYVFPSGFATQEYANALTLTGRDLQRLATSSQELGQLLIKINNQSLSGDFNGFFDLIVKAKIMVAAQKDFVGEFSQHITALSGANQSTKDATTRSMTLSLLETAVPVERDLDAYTAQLEGLLSGSVPSAEAVRNVGASATQLSIDLQKFVTQLNQLNAYFTAQSPNTQ